MKRRELFKYGAALAFEAGTAREFAGFIKEDTERWAPATCAAVSAFSELPR